MVSATSLWQTVNSPDPQERPHHHHHLYSCDLKRFDISSFTLFGFHSNFRYEVWMAFIDQLNQFSICSDMFIYFLISIILHRQLALNSVWVGVGATLPYSCFLLQIPTLRACKILSNGIPGTFILSSFRGLSDAGLCSNPTGKLVNPQIVKKNWHLQGFLITLRENKYQRPLCLFCIRMAPERFELNCERICEIQN